MSVAYLHSIVLQLFVVSPELLPPHAGICQQHYCHWQMPYKSHAGDMYTFSFYPYRLQSKQVQKAQVGVWAKQAQIGVWAKQAQLLVTVINAIGSFGNTTPLAHKLC